MSGGATLGLLGGAFDPVHLGHLAAAEAARAAFGLARVRLVPTGHPPHRQGPRAPTADRLAMVRLAVAERPDLEVWDVELRRAGPSFTVDTLRACHAEGWTPAQLFFILGADAFADIATWHEFPAVLDAAHFVVIARPGSALGATLARRPEIAARVRQDPSAAAGTAILPVEADTPDVSSSGIRRRLAAGEPVDGLVPPAVADYIHAHHLYGSVVA